MRSTPAKGAKGPLTIVIARGDYITHFNLRPPMIAAAGMILAALVVAGLIHASSYIVLRNEQVNAAAQRQERARLEYRDQISALQAEIDRLNTQRALEQKRLHRKIEELGERQLQLERHKNRLDKIDPVGVTKENVGSNSSPHLDLRASLGLTPIGLDTITTGKTPATLPASRIEWPLQAADSENVRQHSLTSPMRLQDTLGGIEQQQVENVVALTEKAHGVAEVLTGALEELGVPAEKSGRNIGGPFFSYSNPSIEERVEELDHTLDMVESLSEQTRALPLASPLAKVRVTSAFGMRRDPILYRRAFHSGIDLLATNGAAVRSGGAGKVVKAGWNGGYGRMIEIDHGRGITSQYAHLSAIHVRQGDRVDIGTVIGRAGSSGRSTGPHLHYEISNYGRAVNPMHFIEAGRRINALTESGRL